MSALERLIESYGQYTPVELSMCARDARVEQAELVAALRDSTEDDGFRYEESRYPNPNVCFYGCRSFPEYRNGDDYLTHSPECEWKIRRDKIDALLSRFAPQPSPAVAQEKA